MGERRFSCRNADYFGNGQNSTDKERWRKKKTNSIFKHNARMLRVIFIRGADARQLLSSLPRSYSLRGSTLCGRT